MWRAFFLAIGISLIIVGAECMVVHKAVLAKGAPSVETEDTSDAVVASPREIKPPEWAPWSFIGGGAVVLLYSFSLPKRFGNA